MASNQQLIDTYNTWRVENSLNPLGEKNVSILLKKSLLKCQEMIDEHKAKEEEKMLACQNIVAEVVEEMASEVASEVASEKEEDDEWAELDTMEGLKAMVIRLIHKADKQGEKIKRLRQDNEELRERLAKLEKKKATNSTATGVEKKPKKNGECEYLFTKGFKKHQKCGRECVKATEGEPQPKFCIQHMEFVATAEREGFLKPVVVKRDEEFEKTRCKHIMKEGLKEGLGCRRLGLEKFGGYCTIHQKDFLKASKKRKNEETEDEDEEDEEDEE